MIDWKDDKELQEALQAYLTERDLILPDDVEYESSIDCVLVMAQDKPIFIIGLPPVSNYTVRETMHTAKYLKQALPPKE